MRPLSLVDDAIAAHPLLARMGLPQSDLEQLENCLERLALVTGLNEASHKCLLDAVDTAWIAGCRDSALIRYTHSSLTQWCTRLSTHSDLLRAFKRLARITAPLDVTDIKGHQFKWGSRTYLMGVVNVTPDSFSDGGMFASRDAAVAHGEALAAAGADVVDIGGQSTRPGALPISETEECDRVLPVVERLHALVPSIPLSVDTSRVAVAQAALTAGAALVNDVTGLADEALVHEVIAAKAGACAMHMQGTPETMQDDPHYEDVVSDILDTLELALQRAELLGLSRSRILVDPGIGFGKTVAHNLYLLRRLGEFRLLGAPILLGTSRKSFLHLLAGGKPPSQRITASAASVAIAAVQHGADMVRVHDVAETRDAVAVADAVRLAREGGELFGAHSLERL